MKNLIISLFCVVWVFQFSHAQTIVGGQQVVSLPQSPWATTQALVSLPSDYGTSTTKRFALIVWLHGVGQAGTNISGLLTDHGGLPYRISQGFVPQAVSPVDGKTYEFIVVSPQSASWSYQYQQIQFILPGILAKYRIDTTRIYITGLSAGGNGALTCITDDPHFCGKIAAVSVMSAASITATEAAAMKNVAINHLPFWDICGTADPNGFYPPNVQYVNTVWANSPNPTPDSTWLYGVGHSSWFEGYDPNWKGRSGHSNGLNMYEWFLLWQRGVTIPWGPGVVVTAPPPNPVAKVASANITLTLPLDSTILDGSSSTPPSGGSISSYQWSVLSGPAGSTLRSTSSAKTELTNLVAGTYKVVLTVTGNLGGVSYDTVTVTVNPGVATTPAAVINPSTISLMLPINSTTLDGSGSTDVGGTLTSYTWNYVSGPATYALLNGTTPTATLATLASGSYVFSLTVKDNQGATSTSKVTVTVNSPAPPVAATTNNNISITLPVDTALLNGSSSTAPGGATLTGYQWTILSGPAGAVLVNASSAIATLKGLVAGTYKIVLTVTDSQGKTASDTVTVLENPLGAPPSVCAGKRILMTQQGDQGITMQGENLAYNPGDTLVIPNTGTPYTWIDFTDIYGTATCPVTIINSGGQVPITVRFNCGNCRNVHMTGTGNAGVQYGFLLANTTHTSAGIDIYGRSANVEMDHFSIHGMDYGIWVKQDQGCIDSLNYPNWTIDHISIHDNRIVGMYDEGMYLGTTDPNGTRLLTCNGVQPNPLPKPLRLSNFSIYNNYIDSTGRSGIQLSCAQTGDNEIYNNQISNNGLQLNSQQGNGISLGGYTTAHVHDNVITNTFTMGIFSLGAGLETIDHNTISLSGHLEGGSPQSASIMVDTRPTTPADSTTFLITNNKLGTNTDNNIRVYNSYPTYAYANVICSNTQASGAPATFAVPAGVHYSNTCSSSPPGNGAPVARAGGKYTITLPVNSVTLNGSGSTDATATIIAYQWTYLSGPGAPVLGNAGTVTPTFSKLGVGTYTVLLTITDSTHATATDTATVVVLPASTAGTSPIAAAGGVDTLFLPSNTFTLNGTGSYAQGGATIASYQWKVISGPAGYVLTNATSAVATISNMNTAGTYKVVLTVTDSKGVTATDTATVVVLAYNQIPTAIISNTVTTFSLPYNLVLDGSHSYVPNSLLTYAWTQVSGPNAATFATPTGSTTAVTNLQAGTYVFKLTVTDLQGEPASATITMTVSGVAGTGTPTANAGGDKTITLPTNSVSLSGTGSTESGTGSIVSYQWTVLSGPAGYVWSGQTTASATLSSLVAGTYQVVLTVTDNSGKKSSNTITVTVNPAAVIPGTPNADAGVDITITLPTNSASLNGSGSSETGSGSLVSYDWTVLSGPAGYTLNGQNSVTATLSSLVAGTYQVVLTVTDNSGHTSSDTVTVTVKPAAVVPGTPKADAGGDITITLPTNSTTLNGSGSSETGNGSIVSYNWTVLSGPAGYTLSNQTTAMATLGNLSQGNYVVVLTVTDNNGKTASDTADVTVSAAATVPPVAIISNTDTVFTLPYSLVLDGSNSYAPSSATLTAYTWTEVSGPTTAQLVTAGGTTTAVNNLAGGIYVFRLTVKDSQGQSVSTTITIDVTAAVVPGTPQANAGGNINITLPTNSVTMNGTGSTENGTGYLVSYQWNVLSGPGGYAVSGQNSATGTIDSLSVGTYVITLTVTDNNGNTSTDTAIVTVSPAGKNPIAIISNTVTTIALPDDSLTLDGSKSYTNSPGANIASYVWTQVAGPSTALIATPGAPTTAVGNLVAGEYVFQLTVTDNSGRQGTTLFTLEVQGASATGQIRIYPNPVKDNLNLYMGPTVSGKVGVIIYDMNGNSVANRLVSLTGQAPDIEVFDVQSLPSGVYVLRVQSKDNNATIKFIKTP